MIERAIKEQVSKENFPTKISFWMIFRGRAILGFAIFFILFIISIFAAFYDGNTNNDFPQITLVIFLIIIFAIAEGWISLKVKLIEGFAKSKGLIESRVTTSNLQHPQSIVKLGNYRKKHIYFANSDGTKSIELIYITIHGGKNNEDTIAGCDITLMTTKLGQKYPFAQAINKQLQLKPKHIIRHELHTTESNQFNDSYYLNADEAKDAFYVFNPATIYAIIKQANNISVEVCEDNLRVFTSSPIKTINDLENVWNTMIEIQDTLN